MTTKRFAIIGIALAWGLLPGTALGLFQQKTEESITVAAGFLGQASYWNNGTNGWTMARYSKTGYPIDYYWKLEGSKYNGGGFLEDDFANGSFKIVEMYWNGTIYSTASSYIHNNNSTTFHSYSVISN